MSIHAELYGLIVVIQRGIMRTVLGMMAAALLCTILTSPTAVAQNTIPTNDPPYYGPYNAVFLPDGEGLKKRLVKDDTVTRSDSPWTLYAWINLAEIPKGLSPIAGVGNTEEEYSRFLATDGSKLVFWAGEDNVLSAPAQLGINKWYFVAATFDGREFCLYLDGNRIAQGTLDLGSVAGILQIAPPNSPWPDSAHYGGKIAGLTLLRRTLTADEIRTTAANPANFQTTLFEEASKPWPFQTSQQAGYRAPQDPSTMPRSKASFSRPAQRPASAAAAPALEPDGKSQWVLAGGWKLRPAPKVLEPGEAISQAEFSTKDWWPATIPGTVLTTMIDQGVYADPDYGLNNLAIPESLNKQDYWYRTEFDAPGDWKSRHLTLTFEGINYFATVWLNGKSIGTIKGAFIRGVFDVSEALKFGQTNVLAVRISPPPHPGIPHEQSIKAGAGENGGALCLDGPTFVDTEGWDWIPAIRDRDTGIWQAVTLRATSAVRLGDPQIITKLPLPDTSEAGIEISVPLQNNAQSAVKGTVNVVIENTTVVKNIVISPGKSELVLSPVEFPQLLFKNPRLWWPNGYGKPELYIARVSFSENGKESDAKDIRFGIREMTYELSLLDSTGHLRRVDYSPTIARERNEQVVDVTHEGIRNIPSTDPYPTIFPPEWKDGWKWWVASLKPGAEKSAALKSVEDLRATPYLTIRVNGVRIAARGGSWGMDDSRKRVSREKLEPYFRLHRDANVNIIRNWVGQSTEEVFFDLADEYGLLVWNDFWASTQSYNVEPEDPQLFLDNARDTILRYRNHPSIAIWCGRNEGVPQPTLNEGLDQLIRTLDGTRYYTPTSNQVNLQNSGPYRYVDPKLYFNMLNHGFSVETGTLSFPTVETWKAWIPEPDRWPISDVWAYHDWHADGNGASAPFMDELQREFGAATSLEDFGRKAQMLNYVQHRAIFEGMNAHLWAPNTGRMLWMTQPAWPSSNWQILSSDYDTQASFYGVKKASEMLHVQLDPTTYQVQIINSFPTTTPILRVYAKIFSLDSKLLAEHQVTKDAPSGATDAFPLDLAPLLKKNMVLIKLELSDASGKPISDNFYWLGGESADYRRLNRLPQARLSATANETSDNGNVRVQVHIENTGTTVSLETKLTLMNASGVSRVLPAYYSDNYLCLLPGESREIVIESPASAATNGLSLALRAWNYSEEHLEVVRGGATANGHRN